MNIYPHIHSRIESSVTITDADERTCELPDIDPAAIYGFPCGSRSNYENHDPGFHTLSFQNQNFRPHGGEEGEPSSARVGSLGTLGPLPACGANSGDRCPPCRRQCSREGSVEERLSLLQPKDERPNCHVVESRDLDFHEAPAVILSSASSSSSESGCSSRVVSMPQPDQPGQDLEEALVEEVNSNCSNNSSSVGDKDLSPPHRHIADSPRPDKVAFLRDQLQKIHTELTSLGDLQMEVSQV